MQKDNAQLFDLVARVHVGARAPKEGKGSGWWGKMRAWPARTFGQASLATIRRARKASGGLPAATLAIHLHHPLPSVLSTAGRWATCAPVWAP